MSRSLLTGLFFVFLFGGIGYAQAPAATDGLEVVGLYPGEKQLIKRMMQPTQGDNAAMGNFNAGLASKLMRDLPKQKTQGARLRYLKHAYEDAANRYSALRRDAKPGGKLDTLEGLRSVAAIRRAKDTLRAMYNYHARSYKAGEPPGWYETWENHPEDGIDRKGVGSPYELKKTVEQVRREAEPFGPVEPTTASGGDTTITPPDPEEILAEKRRLAQIKEKLSGLVNSPDPADVHGAFRDVGKVGEDRTAENEINPPDLEAVVQEREKREREKHEKALRAGKSANAGENKTGGTAQPADKAAKAKQQDRPSGGLSAQPPAEPTDLVGDTKIKEASDRPTPPPGALSETEALKKFKTVFGAQRRRDIDLQCLPATLTCAIYGPADRANCETAIAKSVANCRSAFRTFEKYNFQALSKHRGNCQAACGFRFAQMDYSNELRKFSQKTAEASAAEMAQRVGRKSSSEDIEKEIGQAEEDIAGYEKIIKQIQAYIDQLGEWDGKRTIYIYENENTGAIIEHSGHKFVPKPPLKFVGSEPGRPLSENQRIALGGFKDGLAVQKMWKRQAEKKLAALRARAKEPPVTLSAADLAKWRKEAREFWKPVDNDNNYNPLMRAQLCTKEHYTWERDVCVDDCMGSRTVNPLRYGGSHAICQAAPHIKLMPNVVKYTYPPGYVAK